MQAVARLSPVLYSFAGQAAQEPFEEPPQLLKYWPLLQVRQSRQLVPGPWVVRREGAHRTRLSSAREQGMSQAWVVRSSALDAVSVVSHGRAPHWNRHHRLACTSQSCTLPVARFKAAETSGGETGARDRRRLGRAWQHTNR